MGQDLKIQREIFREGSRTFFNSSLFFPKHLRNDVCRLYAFLRVVDDYVDSIPQRVDEFEEFARQYRTALEKGYSDNTIIDEFIKLMKHKRFDPSWVEAFFHSMRLDTQKKRYTELKKVLEYVYGAAEVIGFFTARIMDLPDQSLYYAQLLGRAFQYMNFVRDINEDLELGRRYLPTGDFHEDVYEKGYAHDHKKEFVEFIYLNVKRYEAWDALARKGFKYIPRRCRAAVSTAADMHRWTAKQIMKDPFVIFERKVKPSRGRIISHALFRTILP